MNNSNEIWVIGSINTDMVVKADKLPAPGETILGGNFLMNAGGKGANQAVAAARLSGRVTLVGSVGSDVFGDRAIAGLKRESINCDHIFCSASAASGVALINVDQQGQNHIVVAPGANSALGIEEVERALAHIPTGSLVLLQLEIPLLSVEHAIGLATSKGCRVVLDPAPAQALPEAIYSGTFLLTPNETEAAMLTGMTVSNLQEAELATQELLGRGVENVALTLGENGVLVANSRQLHHLPASEVDAVDSTAAGDCFNGALAVALAGGAKLVDAAAFACKAAAVAVTRMGAQDSLPRRSEIPDAD